MPPKIMISNKRLKTMASIIHHQACEGAAAGGVVGLVVGLAVVAGGFSWLLHSGSLLAVFKI